MYGSTLPAHFTQMAGWDTYCYVFALILTKQYALGISRLQTAFISLDNLIYHCLSIRGTGPLQDWLGFCCLFVFESLPL